MEDEDGELEEEGGHVGEQEIFCPFPRQVCRRRRTGSVRIEKTGVASYIEVKKIVNSEWGMVNGE